MKKKRTYPLRTCLGCGEKKLKRELLRIAKTPEGVKVDVSGKMPGRGAYICYNAECWKKGSKRLPSSLKTHLNREEMEVLGKEVSEILRRRSLIGESKAL